MATITCGSLSYTVDHAVKGADYVHGYDASGKLTVALEGITDFSKITYDETFLNPEDCLEEICNVVKFVSGSLVKSDGTELGEIGGGGTITEVKANGTSVSTSGVADIPAASTSKYGVTKLSSATNSTSTSLAATPAAVKKAYDLANGKAPAYTYGTEDKTAGSSALTTGTLYFVYE